MRRKDARCLAGMKIDRAERCDEQGLIVGLWLQNTADSAVFRGINNFNILFNILIYTETSP
jgi:hypothetical protein